MKIAFISGITKGIGHALADKFLAEGFFVIGSSTTGETDIKNANLEVVPLDLSVPSSIEKCFRKVKEDGKRIDIFINNAGALFDEGEKTVKVDKLRLTLEVNLIGTIDLTERMIECIEREGHIVNISSTAGSISRTGHPGSHFPGHYPAYKISKAALNMYTRTLALRLGKEMTVSSVHPGWVKTDMGGEEANVTPEEAAKNIYDFAITRPESGSFWFNGEKLEW